QTSASVSLTRLFFRRLLPQALLWAVYGLFFFPTESRKASVEWGACATVFFHPLNRVGLYTEIAVHVGKPGVLLLFPLWGVWAEAASAEMDVFLMIRRHKTTIFTDAKESSTVYELKRIVEGILKRPPEEQRLYKKMSLRAFASIPSPAPQSSQT
uniref:Elongin B n=1 Tax=Pseudonaja textilis TaxID=8673 RepID=A0A670Z8E1_PSETE